MSAALALLVAFFVWSDGGEPASKSPPTAPSVVTLAQNGKTYRLAVGRAFQIRLPHAGWTGPRTSSPSVEVGTINFIRDPGYAAWVVLARRPGRATVAFVAGRTRYALTLVVKRPT